MANGEAVSNEETVAQRTDPYRTFNFRVDIENTTVANFSECSGLSSEGDSVDYRAGTDIPLTVRKLIGLRKYSNITLKRGYTKNNVLWKWYQNIVNGVIEQGYFSLEIFPDLKQVRDALFRPTLYFQQILSL